MKYKAISKKTGEWVYGYYIEPINFFHNHGTVKHWIVESFKTGGGYLVPEKKHSIIPETLCMRTGAVDITGKPVYSNDSISYLCMNGLKEVMSSGIVYWSEILMSFAVSRDGYATPVFLHSCININVKGNIHDKQ